MYEQKTSSILVEEGTLNLKLIFWLISRCSVRNTVSFQTDVICGMNERFKQPGILVY